MATLAADCLTVLFCCELLAHLIVRLCEPPWRARWQFYFWPALSATTGALGFLAFLTDHWISGYLYSTYAALAAWLWWTDHRDRRKKLLSKVLGRVVVADAGLKVVPEN